ncbi:hypothetical protein ABNF65_23365 [Paenibacillus larvae]
MNQIEKSQLQRNLDLILYMEAVSQIEAIVDLSSMRKKQKLNEIKQILVALKQEQSLGVN